MPIKRKNFLAGKFPGKNTDRTKHPVVILLSKNKNLAYTVKEISKVTKMKENTIRSMLHQLRKSGAILHRAPYFAWK